MSVVLRCMRVSCVDAAQTLKALQHEQTGKEQTPKQEHDKNVATLMCLHGTFCHLNVHTCACTHTLAHMHAHRRGTQAGCGEAGR
jgi:hypothetical protein